MNDLQAVAVREASSLTIRRIAAVVLGAGAVSVAAQAAVPLPGTPVPATFQVPAVLVVGGLLGSRLGAASLGLYVLIGALGMPVFAPTGIPGVARLIGPTGGYLLAFPVAAAIVGALVRVPVRPTRLIVALLAGLAAVHLGGVAQLAVVAGDWSGAVALGTAPFLVGDALKLLLAGLILWRFTSMVRARLSRRALFLRP